MTKFPNLVKFFNTIGLPVLKDDCIPYPPMPIKDIRLDNMGDEFILEVLAAESNSLLLNESWVEAYKGRGACLFNTEVPFQLVLWALWYGAEESFIF